VVTATEARKPMLQKNINKSDVVLNILCEYNLNIANTQSGVKKNINNAFNDLYK
jgi:hypothetical protein